MSDLYDEEAMRAAAVCADYEPDIPETAYDRQRESLDASEPPLDDEELAEVVRIGAKCLCGRRLSFNPFGGKVKCPNCGAEVGPQ